MTKLAWASSKADGVAALAPGIQLGAKSSRVDATAFGEWDRTQCGSGQTRFLFVCLLCVGTSEAAVIAMKKGESQTHLQTLLKPDLVVIPLSSSTLCMLTAVYSMVWKISSPSIRPERSCSQSTGMDSRDKGNDVTCK